MRRWAAAVMCAAGMTVGLVGIVAPGASAAPVSKAILWRSFTGKVVCGLEIHAPGKPATKVLCAAKGIPAPKGSSSKSGDAGFVQMGVLGVPKTLRLSQNSFVSGSTKPVTLVRGRLWNQVGVTCHVAAVTVMCFNGDNHGFVIGNGGYRTF